MENNEQNKVVEPVSEITNTIMVSEPNNVETPVVEAPVVETPTEEPTQSVTPEPVVIPKGEKPKSNGGIIVFLVIIILALLGVCGYFVYDKYFATKPTTPNTNEPTNNAENNEPNDNGVTEPSNLVESNSNNASTTNDNTEGGSSNKMVFGDTISINNNAIGKNLIAKNIKCEAIDEWMLTCLYNIFLDDILIEENHELPVMASVAESERVYFEKVGFLKDTITDAEYLVFSISGNSGNAYAPHTLFIIDKNGKIIYKEIYSAGEVVRLKGIPDVYINDSIHKIGIISDSYNHSGESILFNYRYFPDVKNLKVNAIKISSGKVNEFVYATYTESQLN